MSVAEIKEFWHGFCERNGVDAAMRAQGDARIEADPEGWADRTMFELLEELGGKPKK